MSDQPAEIPGQSTIEEALTVEGEPNVDPTSEGNAGIPSNDAEPPVIDPATSGESTNQEQPEVDPTLTREGSTPSVSGQTDIQASSDVSQSPDIVHRFRIVHEIADAIDSEAHTFETSHPMALKDALEFLAGFATKIL